VSDAHRIWGAPDEAGLVGRFDQQSIEASQFLGGQGFAGAGQIIGRLLGKGDALPIFLTIEVASNDDLIKAGPQRFHPACELTPIAPTLARTALLCRLTVIVLPTGFDFLELFARL